MAKIAFNFTQTNLSLASLDLLLDSYTLIALVHQNQISEISERTGKPREEVSNWMNGEFQRLRAAKMADIASQYSH